MEDRLKRKRRRKALVVVPVIAVLTVVFAEGACSILFFIVEIRGQGIRAETTHTEHDPLLGWINKPNVWIPDLYGPGKGLRTNSQRFRNDRDFPVAVPPGKRRWICCGDSFTLGYGVDGKDCWCSLLSTLLPDTECVNMGQAGYAVHQAFLWYMRDGVKLEHNVLAFAFISGDFSRMDDTDPSDYPAPRLGLEDGKITIEDVPVPRPSFVARHLPRLREAVWRLRMMWLVQECAGKLRSAKREAPEHAQSFRREELVSAMIGTLNNACRGAGRTLLLIHLPMEGNHRPGSGSSLRAFLRTHAQAHGWIYLDLIADFQNLDQRAVPGLFINDDIPGFIYARGHYNEKGNRYIAELIVRKIANNPALARAVGLPPKAEASPRTDPARDPSSTH